jgi:hypothetical protein
MSEKKLDEIVAINAVGASGTVWNYDFGGRQVDVTILARFNSPANAGSVVIEEGPVMPASGSPLAGTPLLLATITYVAADRDHNVVIQGRPIKILQIRLPGLIGNNGTVTAKVYVGL